MGDLKALMKDSLNSQEGLLLTNRDSFLLLILGTTGSRSLTLTEPSCAPSDGGDRAMANSRVWRESLSTLLERFWWRIGRIIAYRYSRLCPYLFLQNPEFYNKILIFI